MALGGCVVLHFYAWCMIRHVFAVRFMNVVLPFVCASEFDGGDRIYILVELKISEE
jgi:hypothetical protein